MRTVLIIEDEEQTRNIFLKCLQIEGFRALGAGNGIDGISIAQDVCPDLVICDIMMPDMDGYSVLSVLRRSPSTAGIPFIFLTAKVTMADLRQGMELGADDYLTKPCTIDQFLAAIASRLKRHRELKQAQSATLLRHGVAGHHRSTLEKDLPTAEGIFPDCPQLADVFTFLEHHYGEGVYLEDVAQAVGYSPAYLTSLVQEKTGRTVKQWLIERRMAQARKLLQSTTDTIRIVAERSGYSDPGYFTRQFRQIHGVTPNVWRKNVANLTD
jgi:YesN/AraC family two-component response regulator